MDLRLRRDDGFSMIELAVSVAIFGVVMLLLSGMMAVGMRGVLRGKQREVAVQDNAELVEIARSLSYDNLGLVPSDPTVTTDPAIVMHNGQRSYLVDSATNAYEPIVWAVNAQNHPFNPHKQAVQRGSTNLERYVYVTGVDTNSDGIIDYKRVTSRVSWDPQGTSGGSASEVRSQTLVAESALSPVNSPGGAGNAPLSSKALSAAGELSVKVDRAGNPSDPAFALPTDPLTFSLPSTDASTRSHATSTIDCRAQGPTLAGPTKTYGQTSVAVSADDDPTTATAQNPPPQSANPIDPVNGGDEVDQLVVEPAMTYSLGCGATAADNDGQPPLDDGLPLEQGTASGPGTLTLAQDITGTGLGTSVVNVARVMSPSVTQTIDHKTTGVREISASATGSLGETQFQQVAGIIPRGVVRVQAFSYTAKAAASAAAPVAPSLTMPAGIFVEVYDPLLAIPGAQCDARSVDGYCQKTINPTTPGFPGWSVAVDSTQTFNLGLTKVHYAASVSFLPPAVTPSGGQAGPNGETIWSAAYTAASISAALDISVDLDSLPGGPMYKLTDAVVDATLGQASAQGCHGVACR